MTRSPLCLRAGPFHRPPGSAAPARSKGLKPTHALPGGSPVVPARESAAALLDLIEQQWECLVLLSPAHHRASCRRSIALLCLAAAVLAAVLAAAGLLAWTWGALASSLSLLLGLFLGLRGHDRRARGLQRQLEQRLVEGTALDELRGILAELLARDPLNACARTLLALHLLREKQELSALLQLAPLRDRRPDSGEIALLAALAFLGVGRMDEAKTYLDALEMSPQHPWAAQIEALRRSCRFEETTATAASVAEAPRATAGGEGRSLAD